MCINLPPQIARSWMPRPRTARAPRIPRTGCNRERVPPTETWDIGWHIQKDTWVKNIKKQIKVKWSLEKNMMFLFRCWMSWCMFRFWIYIIYGLSFMLCLSIVYQTEPLGSRRSMPRRPKRAKQPQHHPTTSTLDNWPPAMGIHQQNGERVRCKLKPVKTEWYNDDTWIHDSRLCLNYAS